MVLLATLFVSPGARADYFAKVEPRLFRVADGKKADFKKPEKSPKYTALYFSAHWCPPCRAFTPKLVEWYKGFKPQHPDFELIFVSRDKDEAAQLEYMKETGMPWPAVKLTATKEASFGKYGSSGIPYLVLLDENGKDLTGQTGLEGNEWQSPTAVLKKIEELVK